MKKTRLKALALSRAAMAGVGWTCGANDHHNNKQHQRHTFLIVSPKKAKQINQLRIFLKKEINNAIETVSAV